MAAFKERPNVWLLGEDGVLDGSSSVANSERNQLIAFEMFSLLLWSLLALVLRRSEVGQTALDIAIVVRSLAEWINVIKSSLAALHKGRESLSAHRRCDSGEDGCQGSFFHFQRF